MDELKFSTKERIALGVVFVGITLAVLVLYLFDPEKTSIFPKCLLYQLTGFACPSCGLTRGFHALFHGDFFSAINYNALIPLYLAIFIVVYVNLLLSVFTGRGFSWIFSKRTYAFFIFFLLVNLIFGILRNLPFPPFSYLYP
ncbi:MAG: DUF2752 domain-containing protein [Pyrinomonadaceae bacterium]|nr:DUF2752 domain-containing protein [Pyrinomonadaceae bacterium]MDW8305127.1 DUF2752 domain-containing protein [Acidobacteriota bacterium]